MQRMTRNECMVILQNYTYTRLISNMTGVCRQFARRKSLSRTFCFRCDSLACEKISDELFYSTMVFFYSPKVFVRWLCVVLVRARERSNHRACAGRRPMRVCAYPSNVDYDWDNTFLHASDDLLLFIIVHLYSMQSLVPFNRPCIKLVWLYIGLRC